MPPGARREGASHAMPTVRANIAYAYDGFMRKHGPLAQRFLKCAAAVVAIALLLEVFVFNVNYFATAGYSPISLDDKLDLRQTVDDEYLLTEANHVLEFNDLNTEVHNIRLDFDYRQPAQQLSVKVQFTDEAHRTYFDSTDYTEGVPEVAVSTLVDASEYLNLNTSGVVNDLRIEIGGEKVNYPIRLTGVTLNAHHPFSFNTTRFALTAAVLGLAVLFRPRSFIYRIGIVERPRLSKAIIVAVVAVEALVLSSYLFFGSNLVGVATSSYNSGSWNGSSIVNTFEVGGENAQQYAELAKSMTEGKLYLEAEPPEWLQQMDDPYDRGARDELQKATGEDYLFDVAYYDGKYYVYFGVVPVLLFYLPFYVLTGANFPTAVGVLIAVLAFALGCSALLDRFARYHFKRVSLGLYLLLQMPLVLCSGVLYLLKFPTFYSLPIALGLAFSVWGLYLWTRGRTARRRCGWFLAGSLCMALVAGCRPQLLVLSLLAFPLFWRPYVSERRLFTPRGAREFACLVAPYAVVAVGLGWYNQARFGSVTDFGANYNLTVNDMTKRGWNVGRLAPALFSYLLQPPCVSGSFPFLQEAPFQTTYMGQTVKEPTFGGILACLPLLWILAGSRRILRLRTAQRATRTVAGVIAALLAGGVIVALADAEMAGILQRYYADFSFMFLASAVLLAFIVNENLQPGAASTGIFMKALLAAVGVSVAYSLLICFIPEVGWVSDAYPWAYQDIVEMVQFWT